MTYPFNWLDQLKSSIRAAIQGGNPDASNAHEGHADGTHSVRTGFVPIVIGGYRLPDRTDPEKIQNRDVFKMSADQCTDELAALDAAQVARGKMLDVRDVIILKDRGATSFEEWADERRDAIARRLLYGR